MAKIAIIGAGYVGLVTGACCAYKGHHVTIIENNQEKISSLLNGNIPFYEPGLDEIVATSVHNGFLTFASNIADGLSGQPSIVFNCVGTPSLPNGAADLTYIERAAHEIGRTLTYPALVVNKSTVPVGTAKKVLHILQEECVSRGSEFTGSVASNPEFLKEGDAINDFMHPDRIIIGVENNESAHLLYALYQPFITHPDQFMVMSLESAELTKYAANTMLAMRISFMNQLAHLADKVGADIHEIRNGIAKDPRIGPHFLNAGIGYGGSCFPKDVKALIHMGDEHLFPMTLAQAVDQSNLYQRIEFINRILTHYGPHLKNKTAGIWGLAFKPHTDDIRHAPSIDLIDTLLERETKIIAYDPVAYTTIAQRYGNKITLASQPEDVIHHADFLVIATEWQQFKTYTPQSFLKLNDKLIFDGRNCFDPSCMREVGINYVCVGRNTKATTHSVSSSWHRTWRGATQSSVPGSLS